MADKPVSMTDRAYAAIKENILRLKYRPGASVSELKLAEELSMSRNPVRLAVRLLESEGLLIKDHYRQLMVKPVTQKDAAEIYQLRELLEGTAFKQIFDRGRAGEYSYRLEEKIVRMRAAQDDLFAWEKADTELHMEIVSIFDNERISRIYGNNQFELIRIGLLSHKSQTHVDEINHNLLGMLGHMRAGDYPAAYTVLYRDHLITGRDLAMAGLPPG